MAVQSGKVGVSPKDVTLAGRVKGLIGRDYLTRQEAELTYLKIIAANDFLTNEIAEITYQTIADMVNYQLKLISGVNIKRINGQDILGEGNISVLTQEIASGIYQTIQGMSNYALKSEVPSIDSCVQKSEAPGYDDILTKTLAVSTYQTISGMNNYLTNAVASATYQTIASMSDYLTVETASNTYTPLSNIVVSSTLLQLLVSSSAIVFGKNGSNNILRMYTDSTTNNPVIELNGVTYDGSSSSNVVEKVHLSSEFIVNNSTLDLKHRILSGTIEPTSNIGNNGDIYVKYEV